MRCLAAAVVLVLCGVSGPALADPASDPVVTGYALPSTTANALDANAAGLDTVTVVGSSLRPSGNGFRAPGADTLRVGRLARARDLRTELLVNNYSDATESFDPRAARRLLGRPDRASSAADQVAGYVVDGGWGGVNVDFERLRRGDGRGLVAFLTGLRTALDARAADAGLERLTLSIDVSASTSRSAYRARGYRLAEIAAVVDLVQLMTYDEHGPGWSRPGPIGSLGWQRDAVAQAVTEVPAAKLDLGVAGYAYLWHRDGSGRALLVRSARNLAERSGVRPRWHAAAGEWSARLPDGRVLWWSDARSYALRLALAGELGLHGVAVWRLGSADPLG